MYISIINSTLNKQMNLTNLGIITLHTSKMIISSPLCDMSEKTDFMILDNVKKGNWICFSKDYQMCKDCKLYMFVCEEYDPEYECEFNDLLIDDYEQFLCFETLKSHISTIEHKIIVYPKFNKDNGKVGIGKNCIYFYAGDHSCARVKMFKKNNIIVCITIDLLCKGCCELNEDRIK